MDKPLENADEVLAHLREFDNRKAVIDEHERMAQAEVKLMYDVLTEYLGREPDAGDYEKCARHFATDQEKGTYGLLYENKHLGTVMCYMLNDEMQIKFTPNP